MGGSAESERSLPHSCGCEASVGGDPGGVLDDGRGCRKGGERPFEALVLPGRTSWRAHLWGVWDKGLGRSGQVRLGCWHVAGINVWYEVLLVRICIR